MSKKSFVPRTDAERRAWLNNFSSKLHLYASRFSINQDEVDELFSSAIVVGYWLDYQNRFNQKNLQLTQFKNEMLHGVTTGAQSSAQPLPMDEPNAIIIKPDVMGRATSIGIRIKNHTEYTEAIGRDLGLIGADIIEEKEDAKPILTIRLIAGGQPEIVWKKGMMDGIEMYKLDATSNWFLLAYDSYPNYTDTTPLPANRESAIWQYKAIYKFHDVQVGEWSDVASVKVGG